MVQEKKVECHGLDTKDMVFFYEQDFYVLSNFSAFHVWWEGKDFDTSEKAYHWMKFPDNFVIQSKIFEARSAHEAFKGAEFYKDSRRPDWDEVKIGIISSA